MHPEEEARTIIREAEKCIYCGFCEAVCPTLPLGPHRGYGPRGRLSLAAMLARERRGGAEAAAAIYSCLTCGACTEKCPAGILVADIVKAVRRLYALGYIEAPRAVYVRPRPGR